MNTAPTVRAPLEWSATPRASEAAAPATNSALTALVKIEGASTEPRPAWNRSRSRSCRPPLVQAAHGVAVGPVGLDVGQGGQPLLQEGAELRARLPGLARPGPHEPAAPRHVHGGPDRERCEQHADPPVQPPQDDQHADEEQR